MMKVTFKEMKAILDGKAQRAKNMEPIMQKVAGDMETKIGLRFRRAVGPDGEAWAGLATSTILNRRKGRKSGNPKALQDTGTLKGSIHSKFNGVSAVAGTNLSYARYQQEFVKKGTIKTTGVYVPSFKRKSRFGTQTVKSHTRYRSKPMSTPWGNKPGRPFIGFSAMQRIKYNRWVKNYINKP